jgi:hypothetical protein
MQIILQLRTSHWQVLTLRTAQGNTKFQALSKRLISRYGDKTDKRIQTSKSILQ